MKHLKTFENQIEPGIFNIIEKIKTGEVKYITIKGKTDIYYNYIFNIKKYNAMEIINEKEFDITFLDVKKDEFRESFMGHSLFVTLLRSANYFMESSEEEIELFKIKTEEKNYNL